MTHQLAQTSHVAVDAKVAEVTLDAPRERGVLLLDRLLPMASAPLGGGRRGPAHGAPARRARLEARHPTARLSTAPMHRETQKVESCRALAARASRVGTPEGQQAGLFRMKAQSVPLEAQSQDPHHPFRVVLPFEADDKVVGVANQLCLSLKSREHVALAPLVADGVRGEVAQKRRQAGALRRSLARLRILC